MNLPHNLLRCHKATISPIDTNDKQQNDLVQFPLTAALPYDIFQTLWDNGYETDILQADWTDWVPHPANESAPAAPPD